MEIRDIEKLAKLSRLELTDTEKETFARDLENILHYVDQIREVATDTASGGRAAVGDVYNLLREDTTTDGSGIVHESGMFTDKILAEAPDTQDGFIKVKKILG
jgi:aspartyl-tRNA(Asn)/glutamyl-tRNA(Gln) amidotransferase subunit C